MVAAESYQLFTDRAATIGLPLALLGVAHHPLHLVAGGQPAVRISALAGMHQALDTPLYAQLPGLLGVAGGGNFSSSSIKIKAKLLHLMRMTVLLVTSHTQVKVFTHCAVVSCLHRLGASVAVIHKLILAHCLGVQLVQQGQGGVLAPPQGAELVVPVSGHRQECVSAIHQVHLLPLDLHERVRVLDGAQAGC